jgi:hypothetical protein
MQIYIYARAGNGASIAANRPSGSPPEREAKKGCLCRNSNINWPQCNKLSINIELS